MNDGNMALEIMKQRRSVRSFQATGIDSVSFREIRIILRAARWAPSAKNLHPLSYILVRDETVRKQIAQACCQPQPCIASLVIAVIGDINLAGQVGRLSQHWTTTARKGREVFLYMDCGAAVQNMLLAATALGLGGLWISSFDNRKLSQVLDLPARNIPLAIVCIGQYNQAPLAPRRRPFRGRICINSFTPPPPPDPSFLAMCKRINVDDAKDQANFT